jgi:spermidine synthase
MAVEIVLLYTFQTLYGYVYSMVGLVIGVFMFGLVIGSLAMNRRLRRTAGDPQRQPGLRTVLALDLVITVFAAALVLVLALLRGSLAGWPVQVTTFALVAAAGVLGGLIFPLAAAVWIEDRASTGRAASAVGAADNAGACAGALVTGLALVPVLGISGTCLVIAALKAMSALLVGAARA